MPIPPIPILNADVGYVLVLLLAAIAELMAAFGGLMCGFGFLGMRCALWQPRAPQDGRDARTRAFY